MRKDGITIVLTGREAGAQGLPLSQLSDSELDGLLRVLDGYRDSTVPTVDPLDAFEMVYPIDWEYVRSRSGR